MTFQPLLVAADTEKQQEIDHSTQFINYLTLANVQKSKKDTGAKLSSNAAEDSLQVKKSNKKLTQDSFDWSFPVRLAANETGARMTTSFVVEDGEKLKYEAICVSGCVKDGMTYFTLQVDTAPVCFIQNQCPFPLYFGQTLMNLTLKSNYTSTLTFYLHIYVHICCM